MGAEVQNDAGATFTYGEFRSEFKPLNWVAIALGIVLLGLAAIVWGSNIWAALIYVIVAVTQLLIAAGLLYRLNKRSDATSAGNATVQHSWGHLSLGIAAAALFTSEFFAVDFVWLVLAVLVGLGWGVTGVYGIYWTLNRTDARLTV